MLRAGSQDCLAIDGDLQSFILGALWMHEALQNQGEVGALQAYVAELYGELFKDGGGSLTQEGSEAFERLREVSGVSMGMLTEALTLARDGMEGKL